MIDQDMRVWLIEVNENSHLGMPNKEMKIMVPEMIDSMMILVQNLYFNKTELSQDNFVKIYDDQLNLREPYDLDKLYPFIMKKTKS